MHCDTKDWTLRKDTRNKRVLPIICGRTICDITGVKFLKNQKLWLGHVEKIDDVRATSKAKNFVMKRSCCTKVQEEQIQKIALYEGLEGKTSLSLLVRKAKPGTMKIISLHSWKK